MRRGGTEWRASASGKVISELEKCLRPKVNCTSRKSGKHASAIRRWAGANVYSSQPAHSVRSTPIRSNCNALCGFRANSCGTSLSAGCRRTKNTKNKFIFYESAMCNWIYVSTRARRRFGAGVAAAIPLLFIVFISLSLLSHSFLLSPPLASVPACRFCAVQLHRHCSLVWGFTSSLSDYSFVCGGPLRHIPFANLAARPKRLVIFIRMNVRHINSEE